MENGKTKVMNKQEYETYLKFIELEMTKRKENLKEYIHTTKNGKKVRLYK